MFLYVTDQETAARLQDAGMTLIKSNTTNPKRKLWVFIYMEEIFRNQEYDEEFYYLSDVLTFEGR